MENDFGRNRPNTAAEPTDLDPASVDALSRRLRSPSPRPADSVTERVAGDLALAYVEAALQVVAGVGQRVICLPHRDQCYQSAGCQQGASANGD